MYAGKMMKERSVKHVNIGEDGVFV
jgi:hypothetical protein